MTHYFIFINLNVDRYYHWISSLQSPPSLIYLYPILHFISQVHNDNLQITGYYHCGYMYMAVYPTILSMRKPPILLRLTSPLPLNHKIFTNFTLILHFASSQWSPVLHSTSLKAPVTSLTIFYATKLYNDNNLTANYNVTSWSGLLWSVPQYRSPPVV